MEQNNAHIKIQITFIFLLLVTYTIVGIYLNIVYNIDDAYSHIAYIPIALSGLWWGKKSILVAFICSTVLLSFHSAGIVSTIIWTDLVRSFFFIIAALCIGILSENIKRSRKAISFSQEKYKNLINKSLTGILVYRHDSIVFANSRLCTMVGYDSDSMVSLSIWDLIYFEDQDRVKKIKSQRKVEVSSDIHYECRLVTKVNEIIWVEVLSSLVDYEGNPATLMNVYNITDRKETERKRQELSELTNKQEEQLIHSTRLAELGEMAAGIAHELNQPLSGIRNFAKNTSYMIENKIGSKEDIRENLHLISGQVDRASRIIKQMRELTRQSERQFTVLNINSIIKQCIEFLTPQMKLSGVKIILNLDSNLPSIKGDLIRLEQVFINILTNARQAMEEVEVRKLSIKSIFKKENKNHVVLIEISDTGKGFSEQTAKKLFMPFFSTKKIGQGTGLGLSISLGIIKDHNGEIEAYNGSYKGAIFLIRLPAVQENEIG